MAKRKNIDWEKIEADFRVGIKSIRQIATENDISDTAIRKRAKKEDWSRDLAKKVIAKAADLVRTEDVRTKVRTDNPTEKEKIQVGAEVLKERTFEHRSNIKRSRDLAIQMLSELETLTGDNDLFKKLDEVLAGNDDGENELVIGDVLQKAYHKVIDLPGRVEIARKLADILRLLIPLERQAFGMDEDNNQKDQILVLSSEEQRI